MNLYAIPPLITGIILAVIGLFVFLNNKTSRVNSIFALFCSSMVWWLFCYTLMYLNKDQTIAFSWARIGFIGIIFIPLFAYHFIITFLDIKVSRIFILGLYSLSIPSIILSRTNYIYSGMATHFWGFYPTAGKYYIFFLLMFAILFSYGVWFLFKNLNRVDFSGLKRHQIKYVFLAFAIGAFGIVDYLIKYPFINVYPFGYICALLFISLIAYAIVRHHLMDIEVIIKKTLVFTSLFTIVFGIFVSVALLVQQLIGAGNNMIGFAISSILIILIVRPLEDVLTNITNKYLFQKKYDYKQILKAFLDEVITVLSLDTIAKSTLELLDKALHPEIAVILLLNRFEDKYNSYQSLGQVPEISWDNKAVIPSFLKTTKDLLSIEKSSTATKVPDELKEEMGKYAAKIAIPLMLHNDMIGIILMGKKKSDEEYTQDDIDILTDLARTESVAVGNAQLFADTAQNERRAAIGTLAAGINHEVGNPLNIINTKMQVYLMSLERGLYKDKKPEEIIAEAGEIMKVCLQQTTRISEITKKLSSFAKPSKDFKPELTDIEEQIDDTLAVVGHDIELERIEIKKNIQKPLSKILSDKRQVQQILFNIIRNAGQAIKEKGVIEISAVDSSDGNVKIEISDTGHGIPEDKMDKIYEPFFTTKEPGKGTGLGLSIVRQLVWRNKGDIKVRSKVGEGTTFTITFPQAK